jgi:hypothetical protein
MDHYDQREDLYAMTNGEFAAEDFSLDKLQESAAKFKKVAEEDIQKLGAALYRSGIRVICDPDLKDFEFKVSPAIHMAALKEYARDPKAFLGRPPAK